MPSPLRVLIVGNDVSAKAFSAFLKMSRGEQVMIQMVNGLPTPNAAPRVPCSYSRMWIQNDARGRWMALNFFRDQLGMTKIDVARVGFKTGIINSLGKREVIPSFKFMMYNLFSILREPFRRDGDCKSKFVQKSLHAFLTDRFGSRFAHKYGPLISSPFDSQSVLAITSFPQICMSYMQNKSVILSPICKFFNSMSSRGNQSMDVLDHDWHRYMSGGKYIQVPLELEDRLDDWILCNGVVEMSGREVVSVERVVDGRLPKVHVKFSDNSKEEFDIIVTSEKPDFIAKWHLDEVTLSDVFKSQFGLGGRVTSTNIIIHVGEGEDPRRLKAIEKSILNGPAMFWGRVGDGRVIGALIRDGLWDSGSSKLNEKFGITVYHSSDVLLGASDFVEYLEVAFPWMSKWLGGSRVEVLDSIVEEIVFRGVHENKMLGGVTSDHLINTKTLGGVTFQENFLDSLYSFNNKFRLPKFGSQLQVIGPYYYCRSSIGDILNDSKWLADRICERYEEFPKFIENEDNSDWISRGGSISLDGSLGTAKSTRI